jgi:hypothetical protein
MLVLSFFSWWYGRGWKQVFDNFGPRLQKVADSFSIRQLLPTLFAPWRRIITPPGRSLEAKLRAWADNMFSRVIGFVVRLFVLIGAALTIVIIGALTVIEVVAWPLLPVAIPVLIVLGLSS